MIDSNYLIVHNNDKVASNVCSPHSIHKLYQLGACRHVRPWQAGFTLRLDAIIWLAVSRFAWMTTQIDQSIFDFGERAAQCITRFWVSPQHSVNDGVRQGWCYVEKPIAVQWFWLENIEATGVVQAEDELTVGQLVNAHQLDVDHGSEHA